MKVRKFFAPSSREALRMVKEALGPDAVVLSNRNVDGGVELAALAGDDLVSLARPADDGAASAQARRVLESAAVPLKPMSEASELAAALRELAAPSGTFAPGTPLTPANAAARGLGMPGKPVASAPATPFEQSLPAAAAQPAPQRQQAPQRHQVAPAATPQPSQLEASRAQHTAARVATAQPVQPERRTQQPAPTAMAQPVQPQHRTQHTALPDASAAWSAAYPDLAAPSLGSDHTQAPLQSAMQMPVPHAPAVGAAPPEAPRAVRTGLPGMAPAASARFDIATGPAMLAVPPQRQTAPAASTDSGALSDMAAPAANADAGPQAVQVARAGRAVQAAQGVHTSVPEAVAKTGHMDDLHLRLAQSAARSVATDVLGEINSLRGMLETQLAGIAWHDRQRREPVRGELARTLLASGFSAQLTKLLLERLPHVEDHAHGLEWLKTALERNLPVLDSEDQLMERGGVFALMGPTGVGKTTTTAKLAARCVMRYGADRVALLTTDSYRIGAHEQLRIYGKILGVAVHAVKDAADLQLALTELRNKHMVLIDTIGMSQRDRNVSEQVAMLSDSARPVQRLLVMNATSHGDTLNEVVQAYRTGGSTRRGQGREGANELAGCILTKLDEATNIGAVIDTVVRYQLPVHYVSTGQKVPENLYVARKSFLVKSAFCIPRERSPFAPGEEDLPNLMSVVPGRSVADTSGVSVG